MHFPVIDGNVIDVGSFSCGFLYILYRRFSIKSLPIKKQYPLKSKRTGFDFANGISLFPLLILVFSAISSEILDLITDSSALTMSVAGFFGLIAILEE